MTKTRIRAALAAATVFSVLSVSGSAFSAAAAKTPAGPVAVIHKAMDDFNRGDIAGFKAAQVAGPTIIDELPPHMWSGPHAVDAWAADLARFSKAQGQTDGKIKLGAVASNQVDGDTAYVHIHADYVYRDHGKAMVEPASFTFALTKASGEWKLAAWAFNGSKPHAAATAPKPAAAMPKATPAAKPKA